MSGEQQKKIEYRQLGKSGLRVSVPIIGAMSYGSSEWLDWVLNADKALPILKAAWDLGINTIDTANIYSNGESERVVAKFIKEFQIPRHEIIIATKCHGLVSNVVGERSFLKPELKEERQYINQYGLSRSAIFNAVDASLQRLETNYIDLLQIHRFDHTVPVEETMKALHDLVESGKVRYLGASSIRCWEFAMMNEVAAKNGWTKFVSMQDEHSLLYREDEREMLSYCKYNGIGVIPWAPLAAGDLARPVGGDADSTRKAVTKGTPFESKLRESDQQIVNRVEEISKKKGWKMSQVALVWSKTKVTSPIVGLSSIQRLHDALTNGLELTEDEIKYLEEPYVPRPIRGHQ
jgi:aryl-alcohol dehydrogenase-like predicted oxidoreductase